jgi:hypothetical protein
MYHAIRIFLSHNIIFIVQKMIVLELLLGGDLYHALLALK